MSERVDKSLEERIVEEFPQYEIARNGLLVIRSKFYKEGQIIVRSEGISKSLLRRQRELLPETEEEGEK